MSLQILYSFDHIATTDLLSLPNTISMGPGCTVAQASGRNNGGCLVTTDELITVLNNRGFNFAINAHADVTIGAWVVIEEVPSGAFANLLAYCNPSAVGPAVSDKIISLIPDQDGSLKVAAGEPGTPHSAPIANSPSGVITYGINQPHYIEMRVVIGTPGLVKVRVDGITVIDNPSVNTQFFNAATVTHIELGNPRGSTRTRYDDLYVTTGEVGDGWTGLQGVLQIDGKLVPLTGGAGEVTQWVPSTPTGVNFSNVNEQVSPDQNTYNSTSVVGAVDLYNVEDVIYDPFAIQVDMFMRKVAPGPSSVSTVLRPVPGGANVASAAQPLTTQFKYYKQIYTKNPNGNVAWTMAAYNQLQVGVSKAE